MLLITLITLFLILYFCFILPDIIWNPLLREQHQFTHNDRIMKMVQFNVSSAEVGLRNMYRLNKKTYTIFWKIKQRLRSIS